MRIEITTNTGENQIYDNIIEDTFLEEVVDNIHKLTFVHHARYYDYDAVQRIERQLTLSLNNISTISIIKIK